jgi:hypothetical protein
MSNLFFFSSLTPLATKSRTCPPPSAAIVPFLSLSLPHGRSPAWARRIADPLSCALELPSRRTNALVLAGLTEEKANI